MRSSSFLQPSCRLLQLADAKLAKRSSQQMTSLSNIESMASVCLKRVKFMRGDFVPDLRTVPVLAPSLDASNIRGHTTAGFAKRSRI